MSALIDHIQRHTQVVLEETGRFPEGVIDMVFLGVAVEASADANQLKELIKTHVPVFFEEIDPFDGQEHSYLEVGAWLGSQQHALRLMALGSALSLWQLLTPAKMVGNTVPREILQQVAGSGLLTIVAR